MIITLRTSARKDSIGSYTSPIVPRVGEHIHLLDSPGAIVEVTNVCYQARSTDQQSDAVDLQVTSVNDAARQYIGRVLYQIA